ncbi:MAG: hypothetical protein ACPLRS_00065, partial [Hydrogenobacter sp.]
KEKIVEEFEKTYSNLEYYKNLSFDNPYGDGKASERIKNFLLCDEVKNFMLNYQKNYKEDMHECAKVNSISDIY